MNVRTMIQALIMATVMCFGLTVSAQPAAAQNVRVVIKSIEASKG